MFRPKVACCVSPWCADPVRPKFAGKGGVLSSVFCFDRNLSKVALCLSSACICLSLCVSMFVFLPCSCVTHIDSESQLGHPQSKHISRHMQPKHRRNPPGDKSRSSTEDSPAALFESCTPRMLADQLHTNLRCKGVPRTQAPSIAALAGEPHRRLHQD